MKLENTKNLISDTLRDSIPCVFFSGGMDSLLLLYLVKEQSDVPVISFVSDVEKSIWKKFEKLITEWNLTLYTYPVKNRYVVPVSDGLALVDEYGFAGFDLPVIRDISESDRCLADLNKDRFSNFDFGFDTVFTGVLKDDDTAITGKNWFDVSKQQGKITFVQPLFDWTKEEVEEEIKNLGLMDLVVHTNSISVCTKCLHGKEVFCPAEQRIIAPIDFNGEEMMSAFRHKFGF